jgi:RHS repeat-associated protein
MEPALSTLSAPPLVPAWAELSENSRPGSATSKPALHPGHDGYKSTTALGLQATLFLNGARSRCPGKERDQESGNDYFGARYYASTMGRWMSPDPSNLGVDIYMPQTWNRYNYAVNNPLTIKDANGLWPFYIHNEIINESFPGMSKQDLQGLKSASWNMDFGKGQQDPSMSYEHGMSDGTTNQDPMVAQQMGDDFISQQVQTAQQAQADWEAQGHTGIAPAALTAFGNALHTATDRTSPSHRGNQPWKNEPWYKKSTRDHVAGEATINANDRRAAQNAAQQLFHRTFGDEFDWMLQKQPCAQTSATDSQGNTTGWSPCQ